MTNLRELLAQNIKKYRRIQGFSQESLAEKAGTSTTHIGMIEIGKKFPSVQMLEHIAAALGIDTPELFTADSAVFLPDNSASAERLYQDIMGDFDNFRKNIEGKMKKLHQE